MRTHDEIEQERETRIERLGYTPDLEDGPSGDGVHGRYAVVAVYRYSDALAVMVGRPEGRKVLSRWSTSTMAEKIADLVTKHGADFSFIEVVDEHDPDAGWLSRKEKP